MAILSALGKTSTKEIAAYKRMLEMQQGGMSASEAIAEMTKRGDDSLDAEDVDSDIGGSGNLAPDLDAPQLDAWNKQRVDNLFDALAAFKRGDVTVLVASRTIGEGVDGLQQVGNRVILLKGTASRRAVNHVQPIPSRERGIATATLAHPGWWLGGRSWLLDHILSYQPPPQSRQR